MKCYKKDYPRPQFVRDNWDNWNGTWDFSMDGTDYKILVPFTYETKMSGIGIEEHHDTVCYRRKIQIDGDKLKNHDYLLHFEGSDFETFVWVNEQFVGSHRGGYARFSFEISSHLVDGENEIRVVVKDYRDAGQPRGKQRWITQNFGCWYVQTTGIWKTVWGEYVPKARLESVKMTPDMQKGVLNLSFITNIPEDMRNGEYEIVARATFEDAPVSKMSAAVMKNPVSMEVDMFVRKKDSMEWGLAGWNPWNPSLYDLTFTLEKNGEVIDSIGSYCAMRDIRIEGCNVLLNGEPIYQRLILDQGYWKDSHLTPPDEEALIKDIDRIKELGYNGLRKHQKTEDERFLYWCDVKGMLVWSEVASAYDFNDEAMLEFTREWAEIVKQNYNHPCIITWTPFNESWGLGAVKNDKKQQYFTESVYYMTKSIDPYRPVITNDGWEHTISDIITLHDYEEAGEVFKRKYMENKDAILDNTFFHCGNRSAFANGYKYKGQPIIISEFGGIAFDNTGEGWGYGNKVADKDAFIKRFDSITTAIKELPFVCGYCYTQVSDVQQEINGLMDEERNFKVDPAVIREINERKIN